MVGRTVVAALAAVSAAGSPAAHALGMDAAAVPVQYRDGYGDGRRGGYEGRRESAAPGGSYLQSCERVQVQGSTLSAICRGGRGRSYETSLDLTRCGRSDIGNNGGMLDCNGVRGRSRPVN